MKHRRAFPQMAVALVFCVIAAGCAPAPPPTTSAKLYSMGENTPAGTLIYNVIDAEWMDQLGEAPNSRTPKQRFVAVRVSVTNSGASLSGIPPMKLIDPHGIEFEEMVDASGLTEWFGSLRHVQAAETVRGRVLFDVPVGAYRLRVANDADPEHERAALIEIPLQLGQPSQQIQPVAVPVPPPAQPAQPGPAPSSPASPVK